MSDVNLSDSMPHNDACMIMLAGPIDPEYGPPLIRAIGTLASLGSEFRLALADERLMAVTSYHTSPKDGSITETFPILVNPVRIETINHASKGDRRAAGWVEEGDNDV